MVIIDVGHQIPENHNFYMESNHSEIDEQHFQFVINTIKTVKISVRKSP